MTHEIQWTFAVLENGFKLGGEVDYTVSPELRTHIQGCIDKTQGDLEADLGELDYLDSSGLAVFIEARRKLGEQNRGIRITAVRPQVEKIFKLTQVGQLFGL